LVVSIVMGLMVIKTSLEIIIDNSLSIIGEVEEDKEIITKLEEIETKINGVKEENVSLIKYGSYYKLQLSLVLDSDLSLRRVINLENKIKKLILKEKKFNIKYITINVTNELD